MLNDLLIVVVSLQARDPHLCKNQRVSEHLIISMIILLLGIFGETDSCQGTLQMGLLLS